MGIIVKRVCRTIDSLFCVVTVVSKIELFIIRSW